MSKVLGIYTCTYMHIYIYIYIYMNPCWPNCLQVRGIVRRPRPHYISFTRPKAVGEGRSMSCPVLGPRSGWGHVFHGGKPRGPKTSPCPLSPQTGSSATKICPILFFHFPKKDSGPPRNACQKLEKIHSALQGGNGQDWLHLGTLKKGSHSMSSIMQTSCL